MRIHRIQNAQSSPSRDTYINPNSSGVSTALPQLACYYHLGGVPSTPFELRQGNIPDSRRGFHLHSGQLLYPFATRTHFGVARATGQNAASPIISAASDKSFNLEFICLRI